jgi:hypothetical protein
MTHQHEGELVVFMLGMTINKWWRVDLWLPTLFAVTPMIDELKDDPDRGMLGFRLVIGSRGPVIIQYWGSLDKLLAYATAKDATHLPRWTKFTRSKGLAKGAVGIWHETFLVDKAESLYIGTPEMGLARATEVVTVTKNSARERIGAK